MLKRRCPSRLWLYFTGIVFATILAVFFCVSLMWLGLYALGRIDMDPRERHAPLVMFFLGSLLLGGVIAVFVGRLIVAPIQSMGEAFDELSRGNFGVRVPENQKIPEIREMAQRFNAMTYDLSHIETLRSDFVANVSHEFKTPIAAIEGYATLLQSPGLSGEKHGRYVEKILENSRRLTAMSGNILLLSRLENQETVPDQGEFRLDEQLRQCVLTLERAWTEKKIDFDIDLPRQMYYGSRGLLEQVWLNILDNAIKHSPVGGCIRIRLERQEGNLCVSIGDQGEGMTEQVQRHIFEKFYQGDPSRTREGNGLGLALVKRIIQLCGGTVEVVSAPGQGAEFTVCLPERN